MLPPAAGIRCPSRRLLLLALPATGLLAGCRVQLEEGAPDLPLLPRRPQVPLEHELLELLTTTTALASSAASSGVRLGAQLAPLHTTQADLLRDALLHGGVPTGHVQSAVAAAAAVPPVKGPAALADAELTGVRPPGRLAGASVELRPSLLALCAQRLAAARLLQPGAPSPQAGPRTPSASDPTATPFSAAPTAASAAPTTAGATPTASPAPSTGPAFPPPAQHALGDIRLAVARARYLLQVAAARSSGVQRTRALTAEEVLRTRLEEIEALLTAPSPLPLGHALPFPVAGQADAARLAAQAVTDLVAAFGRALPKMTSGGGGPVADAFDLLAPWLADAVVLGHGWGVALTAFPGLT